MNKISQVNIHQVKEWMDRNEATVLDIRDPVSFSMGHIPTARRLGENNLQATLSSQDKNRTLVLCCYHGISSQGAAGYFMEQGFRDVHSMQGGYEAWAGTYPAERSAADSTD
ncbi:MAG: thiosulfate sulfurtransferase GlpE [Nitrospinaceae bacterium]